MVATVYEPKIVNDVFDLIDNYVPGYTKSYNSSETIYKISMKKNGDYEIYMLYFHDMAFLVHFTFPDKIIFVREDMCKLLHKCMNLEEWNLYHVIINYL